jgi:hypothetical protein
MAPVLSEEFTEEPGEMNNDSARSGRSADLEEVWKDRNLLTFGEFSWRTS